MVDPKKIEGLIADGMPGADVRVLDPMNDGTHLEAVVVSADFDGKMLIARHRMVYAALGDVFDTNELHALKLTTKTPTEMESAQ